MVAGWKSMLMRFSCLQVFENGFHLVFEPVDRQLLLRDNSIEFLDRMVLMRHPHFQFDKPVFHDTPF